MTKIGSFFWRILAACVAYAYHIDAGAVTQHEMAQELLDAASNKKNPTLNYDVTTALQYGTNTDATWESFASGTQTLTHDTDPNRYNVYGTVTAECTFQKALSSISSASDYCFNANQCDTVNKVCTYGGSCTSSADCRPKSSYRDAGDLLYGLSRAVQDYLSWTNTAALDEYAVVRSGMWSVICDNGEYFAGVRHTTAGTELRLDDYGSDSLGAFAQYLYTNGWDPICESNCGVEGTSVKSDYNSKQIAKNYRSGTVLTLCSDRYPWGTATVDGEYGLISCIFRPTVGIYGTARATASYLKVYSAAEACKVDSGATGVDETGAYIFTADCDPLNP